MVRTAIGNDLIAPAFPLMAHVCGNDITERFKLLIIPAEVVQFVDAIEFGRMEVYLDLY